MQRPLAQDRTHGIENRFLRSAARQPVGNMRALSEPRRAGSGCDELGFAHTFSGRAADHHLSPTPKSPRP
jgi:hypothetical protein